MATTNQTTTKTFTELELTPPDPVPMILPEKAAGLVPVDAEKKSAREEKVEGFVNELIALCNGSDVNRCGEIIIAAGAPSAVVASAQSADAGAQTSRDGKTIIPLEPFNGIYLVPGVVNVSRYPCLFGELMRRGYSDVALV